MCYVVLYFDVVLIFKCVDVLFCVVMWCGVCCCDCVCCYGVDVIVRSVFVGC